MIISKQNTIQEEWQLIWKYCPHILNNLIIGGCPSTHDFKDSDKCCTGEIKCKQCWHDAIWGDDKE